MRDAAKLGTLFFALLAELLAAAPQHRGNIGNRSGTKSWQKWQNMAN